MTDPLDGTTIDAGNAPDFILADGSIALRDALGGLQALHHCLSGEVVLLPGGGGWVLEADEDGHPYVYRDDQGDVQWAQAFFDVAAYVKAQPQEHEETRFVSQTSPHVYMNGAALVPIAGGTCSLEALVFQLGPSRVWWNFHDISARALLPSRGGQETRHKPWRIVQERWTAWESACRVVGAPPLRKAKPYSAGREQGNLAKEAFRSGRILQAPSTSTLGLCSILARLGGAPPCRGGCGAESGRSAAQSVLRGLCGLAGQRLFGSRLFLDLSDHACLHESGLRLEHDRQVVVEVPISATGLLRLQPLLAVAGVWMMPRLKRWLLEQDTDSPRPLHEWLFVMTSGTLHPEVMRVFRQLVWCLAESLEGAVVDAAAAVARGDAVTWMHYTSTDGLSEHQRSLKCAEMLLAGREACKGATMLCASLDASRVGHVGRMSVAFALHNNLAWWAPPQALHRGFKTKHRNDETNCLINSRLGFNKLGGFVVFLGLYALLVVY